MIEIPLTQGQTALIDDEEWDRVKQYKWFASKAKNGNTFYAQTHVHLENGKRTTLQLHRLLMDAEKRHIVDHQDRNGLNCQKYNLRFATRNQNCRNQGIRSDNSSGYKGVSKTNLGKQWSSYIYIDGKQKFLGKYSDKESAARAYNEAAIKYFGEFAVLNTIEGLAA